MCSFSALKYGMALYFQPIFFIVFFSSQVVANLYRKFHFDWLDDLISLVNKGTKLQNSLFVRLPDNGCVRRAKHVVVNIMDM
jgi:hypothetical protein